MKTKETRALARASLDRRLQSLAPIRAELARPRHGWLRAIRNALGMTTAQLGKRLGIAQASVVGLEKAEAEERIQLGTLRRAAEALNCELHYVLLPKIGLQRQVDERLVKVAAREQKKIAHTMGLEGQYESDPVLQDVQTRAVRLGLHDRDLWKDD